MIGLGISGALGRMGTTILELALKDKAFEVRAAFERISSPHQGRPVKELAAVTAPVSLRLEAAEKRTFKDLGVVIDFTEPKATLANLQLARKTGTAMVIGTTGFDSGELDAIRKASEKIAVVLSPNMSVGANLLFDLAAQAARILDETYDIEITEAHHKHKKDAPSGTAKRLAEAIAEARGWNLDNAAVYGRQGIIGERPARQIGIHSIRAGEIVGVHTAIFSGPGETIEITHTASSRQSFAKGALLAAKFVSRKKTGLFNMTDVLHDDGGGKRKK